MRAAKLVHELLPERGAALFEQLGANAQRAARGPVAKSPAAELREHGYELDRGFGQAVADRSSAGTYTRPTYDGQSSLRAIRHESASHSIRGTGGTNALPSQKDGYAQVKTQHAVPGPARLIPMAAVTLTNYAAQVPYYLHNDYSPHHLLPGVRALDLLGVTLAWFALGLAGFMRQRRWGFAVLASFLVVEAVFYAGNFVTGVFIFQIENHSDLMKAVFVIGYASGAVAAYYAYRLVRDRFRPS
jgi:hypothetical protein